MLGTVTLKAGRYPLAADVWLEIQQDDRGTSVVLCDQRTNARYFLCVDEAGEVAGGHVRPLGGKERENYRPPTPPPPIEVVPAALRVNARLREAGSNPLICFPAHAKHRFTLWLEPRARARRQVWPIAGYEGDGGVYVMYRRRMGRRGECLIKVVGDRYVVLEDDSDPCRLPRDEWEKFLHLPARKRFTLASKSWRKMSVADLGAAVGGRVWPCWDPLA
ncbi:MAG TPA: hypothetical protein VF624_11015 [Tepidisphaeraceae bacterium]|jgi:hypothetical protein